MRCTNPVELNPVILSRQVPEAEAQLVPPPTMPSVPNDIAVDPPPPDNIGCPDEPAVVGRLKL